MQYDYCACYCEENVWHLCQHERFADAEPHAVFISNRRRACPLYCQRSASNPGEPMLWDYHVVLFFKDGPNWNVWDLDTVIEIPASVDDYLRQTFPFGDQIDGQYVPSFRPVAADEFVPRFASDRSHMKDFQGKWLAPPPSWPAIQSDEPISLAEYLDFDLQLSGPFISLHELEARFCGDNSLS